MGSFEEVNGEEQGLNSTSTSKWEFNTIRSRITISLVRLKLIFFTFLGGQGVMISFRALFAKHVGLSTTQSGIIWSVDRVLGIITPPLLGALSDKTQKPHNVIAGVFSIAAVFVSIAVFIPHQNVNMEVSCSVADLYPVLLPGSFPTQNYTVNCYQFTNPNENVVNSICITKLANYSDLHQDASVPHVWNQGRVVDQCEENVKTRQVFFMENNKKFEKSFHHKYLCNDTNCKEMSQLQAPKITSSNLSNPVETVCLCYSFADDSTVYGLTFWIFLVINCFISLATLSSQGLVDVFVMNQLPSNKKHHFGYQRLWGSIGFGCSTLLGGFLKDVILKHFPSTTATNIPFLPIFIISFINWTILSIIVKRSKNRRSDNSIDDKEEKFKLSNVKLLLADIHIFMFVLFASIVGFSLGMSENYAFMLAVDKLNASGTVLGLSIGLASIFDVIMYLASTKILKRFRPIIVMIIGTQVLTSKLLFYTFCTTPWHFILVEQIGGLSWGITWTAVCNYTTNASPKGLTATMMGIVSMGAWGLGYGLASLLGGILYEQLGGDVMFRIAFAFATSIILIYYLFTTFYSKLRRLSVSQTIKYAPETKITEDINRDNV